jgi:hypothetical protein
MPEVYVAVLDHASTPAQLLEGVEDVVVVEAVMDVVAEAVVVVATDSLVVVATDSLVVVATDSLVVVATDSLVVVVTDSLVVVATDSLVVVATDSLAVVVVADMGKDKTVVAVFVVVGIAPPPRVPPAHALTVCLKALVLIYYIIQFTY